MHELYELKELLCKELEEIGGKGELTAGSLETVDTLAHALKNIDKIIESKEDEEYSGRYYDGSYNRSYARGRTNARRDSMGRYSREGYSRAAGDMADRMRSMAAEAPDETTRREMERMADKMEKM
jgi:hypothetical protein